ncbi:MAG: hypothetical protein HY820_41625 [Acidobacteria bacterium]|nr:hypothetical protein [Acidobacteriota bacterium]
MTAAEQTRPARWAIFPLAHPDAKLLIGLDWRRILESPLGPAVLRQVQQGVHPLLGFLESIENLDRMMVSSPGSDDGGKAPMLVVGEGRFALAKIRAMAKSDGAISKRYNDVELLVPPNAGTLDLHFALLDSQTILFGDGTSVKQAIDRWQRGEGGHDRNPSFARAQTLSNTQQAWAVIREPNESLASLGIAGSTLAEQTEFIEVGLSFNQTFNASLWIKAVSEEGAQLLSTGLPALLQMAAVTYTNQPSLTQLARRLKVTTEQTYLKMGFSIDSKLMEQSIAEFRAASQPKAAPQTAARLEAPTAAQLQSASQPTTPVRKIIRIVGMDEGVKEIPYTTLSPAPEPQRPPN